MDFKVASSIYRKPWLIERQAAIAYMELLQEMKAGTAKFSKKPSVKLEYFKAHSEVITAPIDRWSAKEHPGYEGKSVAILPLTGPLMKEDFCGEYGTASLRSELQRICASESVKTVVLLIDSPGGTVDGTQAMADAIKACGKETVAVIDGMMCSAAYWIGSAANRMIATSGTDIIGSIGTMISMYDSSARMEEMGVVLREYYADASSDKNRMFTEARDGVNKGRLLIEQLLNPLNDIFLAAVKQNRGKGLNAEETLTGKTFLAADALQHGLIDEIATFDSTVNNLLQKHKTVISMSHKWTKIKAFFGIKAETEKVEMSDEQLDKLEASLASAETAKAELETTTAKVTELETAATASAAEVTALKAQVATLTSDKAALAAKVEELGAKDGAQFTTTTGEADPKREESKEVSASEMSFQQDLMSKVD